MPNMFIVGTLQGKTFDSKQKYEIFSKTSSIWAKESEHGLGNSFKSVLARTAFNINDTNKTFDYNADTSADIKAFADDLLKRGKHEKAAQIYFLLAADPAAVGSPKNYIGQAYEALVALYGPKGQLAKQMLGSESIYSLITKLAKKYNDDLALLNKVAQESKEDERHQADMSAATKPAALNTDAPILSTQPLFTPKREELPAPGEIVITGDREKSPTPPALSNLSVTVPTTPKTTLISTPKTPTVHQELPQTATPSTNAVAQLQSSPKKLVDDKTGASLSAPPSPMSAPLSPSKSAKVSITVPTSPMSTQGAPLSPTKSTTPVESDENKHNKNEQVAVTTSTPPSSPTSAPLTPTKSATPIANYENEQVVAVTTAAPPSSPTSAPLTPTKSATPIANNQNEQVAVTTSAPPSSPTSAPLTPAKSATPVTGDKEKQKESKLDQHEPGLFGANDIPAAAQQASVTLSTPTPTPPKFPRVEKLLNNLNVIAGKYPAINSAKAIQDEQKAMFLSKDPETLSLKNLSYDELNYLSNHMDLVQRRKALDTRFDHLRTETGSFRKHLDDGKGETPAWREIRTIAKQHAMVQAALAAQKAERDLAAQQAAVTVVTDASVEPVTSGPANAKIKLPAERHKELAALASQHSGRPYGIFGQRGQTNSTKFFNAHFEAAPEAGTPNAENTSTSSNRM